uniref:RRM domain-containing protein n=1 Tax=Rhabditophanes sp. KR3021 TaxID=114890 RepID=A0AC35TYS4_9BILA
MGDDSLRVLHVTNVSGHASNDQIKKLFKLAGNIEEFEVYPQMNIDVDTPRTVFIKFEKRRSLESAQHLTNTVFLDKALCCVPYYQNNIPREEEALAGGPAAPGKRYLPAHVSNSVKVLDDGSEMVYTTDPELVALGLPNYPPLSATTDNDVIEEIRRTIYISNIPIATDPPTLLSFINDNLGEVMYMRMCSTLPTDQCEYAYLEFLNQTTIPIALQNTGIEFEGNPLRITHSRVRIIKPQKKTNEQALEEIKEASKSEKEKATTPIPVVSVTRPKSPAREVSVNGSGREKKRESPDRRRRKSASRDRERRKRSDSREKRRKRSRSRERSDRSSKRSDKKERKRSRSRSKDRHRSSRIVKNSPKGRWTGIKRDYEPIDVLRLRGSVDVEYTLANETANRLWHLIHTEKYVPALGAQTGNQAVQMVKAGLKAIYLSGWQVAADANGQMYPDQSLYSASAGPELAKRINNALRRADQIECAEADDFKPTRDYYAPIVADAG